VVFSKVVDLSGMLIHMEDWTSNHPEYSYQFSIREDGVYILVEKECNKKE